MTLDMIREFIVLAGCLNFTKAADTLFLAQPTISRHIALMEKELNLSLFIRNKHEVALTDAGRTFYDYASEIMEVWQELDVELEQFRSGKKKDGLRLGILYYALTPYATPLLLNLAKNHPDIIISLLSHQPASLLDALRNDRIDIGLTYRTEKPVEKDLMYEDIGWEKFALMTPVGSNFASLSSISILEMSGLKIALQHQAPKLSAYIKSLFRQKGVRGVTFIDTEHVDTVVPDMLKYNASAICTMQTAHNLSSELIRFVPISDPEVRIMMTCLYKKNNPNSSIPIFCQAVRETFPKNE